MDRRSIIIGYSDILERDGDAFDPVKSEKDVKTCLTDLYDAHIAEHITNRHIGLHIEIQVPTETLARYFLNKVKSQRVSFANHVDIIYVVIRSNQANKPDKIIREI